MMKMNVVRSLLAAMLMAGATLAHAVPIDAVDRGWYVRDTSNVVQHFAGNLNYLAGVTGPPGAAIAGVYRDFFVFDLSGLAGQTITSATLHLYNPKAGDLFGSPTVGGYFSADATELLEIRQVSDPYSLLAGVVAESVFNDLGDGLIYGTYSASLADNGNYIDVVLNADALAQIQASLGGMFAVGGRVPTVLGGSGAQTIFGYSNNPNLSLTQLLVTVPEPASLAMFALGLMILRLPRRRMI